MRTTYHAHLSELTTQLAQACGLAAEAMGRATQALLQANPARAEQVIADHEPITAMCARAEESAFSLLALQQPVASELRAVVGALQIASDIERMSALAVHVAKIARRCHPRHALPADVTDCFAEMGKVAIELGYRAREALRTRDAQKAARLREDDDAMDHLHRRVFDVLMDREWQHGVPAAVNIALLARYYERFADHTVEIGRRLVFEVTGTLPAEQEIGTD